METTRIIKTADKLAIKEREKADKLELKEREKADKLALKERENAEKLVYNRGIKEGKKLQKIAQQQKMEREEGKFEIRKECISNLINVGQKLEETPTNQEGYSINVIVEKYIELYGYINPYSLEPVEDTYNIKAAIRAIVYESSPSSLQHWFRFGQKKLSTKVCPWIFANKNLAISNNKFNWRKTTDEMVTDKKNNTGLWLFIKEPNVEFCWKVDKYGPLPSKQQLDEAEAIGERVIGIRNH